MGDNAKRNYHFLQQAYSLLYIATRYIWMGDNTKRKYHFLQQAYSLLYIATRYIWTKKLRMTQHSWPRPEI